MDLSWITEQIAVGGGIWNEAKMVEIVRAGVTHIVNMQIEFDDRPLAEPYGVKVLWNPMEDDFQPKPAEALQRGVDFVQQALQHKNNKVFIHCAAGVHRAPMMTLAVLRSLGWSLEDAQRVMQAERPVVDFADVYVQSVELFMCGHKAGNTAKS
jgi:protein-tyrosine phosphatase